MKRDKDILLLSVRFLKPDLMETYLDTKRNVNLA